MKYLELTSDGKYLTFRDIDDYKPGCIEVSDNFPEPPNIFEYKYENGQWIKITTEFLKTLEEIKMEKFSEIQNAFINELTFGYIDFTIPSSNITVQVDARRNNHNNDLQNIEGLIEYMQMNNIPIIEYKCKDNQKYTMTLSDLQELRKLFINRGIELYNKKHLLEQQISNATTIDEINTIHW